MVRSLPVATSHSLIVLSSLAEASILPSGLKATEPTESPCDLRVACSLPVRRSHSLTQLSQLAEASVLPSGLKATEHRASVCPCSVARSLASCADDGDSGGRASQATPTTTPSIRPAFLGIAHLQSASFISRRRLGS